MDVVIQPVGKIKGEVTVPGDKSISHRAAILGAAASGQTRVEGFLEGEDCLSTLECLKLLGVTITRTGPGQYLLDSPGLEGLKEPSTILDVGNSGTTIRLLSGLLAGRPFVSFLTGDDSIRRRPMDRIIQPLTGMGAQITGRASNTRAPLCIQGGRLQPVTYQTPVASAQIKSAILLAGLSTEGMTRVKEPHPSRDHTERMLKAFGIPVKTDGLEVTMRGPVSFSGQEITVPGDISSAAFFLVAATLIPGSEILIKKVGINPTRSKIIDALQVMGADIQIINLQEYSGEPVADLLVKSAPLKGIDLPSEWLPGLIDEVPILAVAGTTARGVTRIGHAAELRYKETDRLRVLREELTRFGVEVEELADGLIIKGEATLRGATCHSHGDHRMAMALGVLGLVSRGETIIRQAEAVRVSFPEFFSLMNSLS
ncbi:MAG TPA: 3-phosphoshikimate 1-carboxyvinyltransferase [Clostridia bacterium]|nr:3-phosphoshikimate 1-carboxyvinyltransferase [Clostridia bacterium]